MRISAITPKSFQTQKNTKTPKSSPTPKYNSPAFKSLVFQKDRYCTDEDYDAAKKEIEKIAAISNKKPEGNEERLLRFSTLTEEDDPNDYPVDVIVKGKNNVNIILPCFCVRNRFHHVEGEWPDLDIVYEEVPVIGDTLLFEKCPDWMFILRDIDPFNFKESINNFYQKIAEKANLHSYLPPDYGSSMFHYLDNTTQNYVDARIVKENK